MIKNMNGRIVIPFRFRMDFLHSFFDQVSCDQINRLAHNMLMHIGGNGTEGNLTILFVNVKDRNDSGSFPLPFDTKGHLVSVFITVFIQLYHRFRFFIAHGFP